MDGKEGVFSMHRIAFARAPLAAQSNHVSMQISRYYEVAGSSGLGWVTAVQDPRSTDVGQLSGQTDVYHLPTELARSLD